MLTRGQWITYALGVIGTSVVAVVSTAIIVAAPGAPASATPSSSSSATVNRPNETPAQFTLLPATASALAAKRIQEIIIKNSPSAQDNRFAVGITAGDLSLDYLASHPDKVPMRLERTDSGNYRATVDSSDLREAGITVALAKHFAEYAAPKSLEAVERKRRTAGTITW